MQWKNSQKSAVFLLCYSLPCDRVYTTDKTDVLSIIHLSLERQEMLMEKVKKWLNEIFIDGLSGMALGLFSTLIIGTIIAQIGSLIGGTLGTYLIAISNVAKSLTGAGIGVGVSLRLKASPLTTVSAGLAGLVGQINTYQTMVSEGGAPEFVLLKIIAIQFILPALLAFIISEIMRKKGWIKQGDMKLDV